MASSHRIPVDYVEAIKRAGLPDLWKKNKDRDPRYQWNHPSAEVRDNPRFKGGKGMFASQRINKGEQYSNGEFISESMGQVVDIPTLESWHLEKQMEFLHYGIQVGRNEILAPRLDEEGKPEDFGAYINHSCDPNIVFDNGTYNMKACRDIEPNEEITIDYGTFMISEMGVKEFKDTKCGCGKALCRGRVTWKDHLSPELIKRYGRNCSPCALESQEKHGVCH